MSGQSEIEDKYIKLAIAFENKSVETRRVIFLDISACRKLVEGALALSQAWKHP